MKAFQAGEMFEPALCDLDSTEVEREWHTGVGQVREPVRGPAVEPEQRKIAGHTVFLGDVFEPTRVIDLQPRGRGFRCCPLVANFRPDQQVADHSRQPATGSVLRSLAAGTRASCSRRRSGHSSSACSSRVRVPRIAGLVERVGQSDREDFVPYTGARRRLFTLAAVKTREHWKSATSGGDLAWPGRHGSRSIVSFRDRAGHSLRGGGPSFFGPPGPKPPGPLFLILFASSRALFAVEESPSLSHTSANR